MYSYIVLPDCCGGMEATGGPYDAEVHKSNGSDSDPVPFIHPLLCPAASPCYLPLAATSVAMSTSTTPKL